MGCKRYDGCIRYVSWQLQTQIVKNLFFHSENPYLGITLTENLKWNSQNTKTTKKENSTLAFLRLNLRSFPLDCRKSAYTTLVRSLLDYGSIIWDPYLKQDIDKLEHVQRQAAHFITGDYKTREEGCVTRMLETIELSSLEQRRSFNRLVFIAVYVQSGRGAGAGYTCR